MKTLSFFLSAAALLGAGCTTAVGAYCDKVCECTDCSRSERRDCSDETDAIRTRAARKSCGAQFDAYVTCFTTSLECASGAPSAPGCEAEADALYACAGDIGIGKTDCEAAADSFAKKYASCGVDLPDGTGSVDSCASFQGSVLACQAVCVEAASSDAITGKDGPGAVELNNCKDACP